MAFLQLQEMPWHQGELDMHDMMHVPYFDNPAVPTLSPQLANHLKIAPLIAMGTLDETGRPWVTLWGGEKGLGQPVAMSTIGLRSNVTGKHDPVVERLFGKDADGQIIREEGRGRMISGLTIDLQTRKRVKFFGRMVVGALNLSRDSTGETRTAEAQLVIKIEQSLGNCPKYLNKKQIVPAISAPRLAMNSARISEQAIDLIHKADLFFVASARDDEDMDTNHRGGPAGFVRCAVDEHGTSLYWPEYSGNRHYATLGNLKVNPLAGISIPDFDTGNMLYMTGKTEILVGQDAASILPKTNLAVKFTVDSARFVEQALPFRGVSGDLSPYNPSVRFLTTEKKQPVVQGSLMQATLLRQDKITPTVSQYRFQLQGPAVYKPGQYVTFDFSELLDIGYSHMRDEDPRSLNDDYVRTFTVSSPQPSRTTKANEFDITIRHVGVVTEHMSKYKGTDYDNRSGFEVGVKGFGGEFEVVQNATDNICFIAAGVGITPLMPALPDLNLNRLRLLWTVRAADIPLVEHLLHMYPDLSRCMSVFVTGAEAQELEQLKSHGVDVKGRRLTGEDVNSIATTRTYICTSVGFRKQIAEWLHDTELVYEDFNF